MIASLNLKPRNVLKAQNEKSYERRKIETEIKIDLETETKTATATGSKHLNIETAKRRSERRINSKRRGTVIIKQIVRQTASVTARRTRPARGRKRRKHGDDQAATKIY